ncbi:MAG: YggT family protein [Candidatus Promineifilaceae bacterium]
MAIILIINVAYYILFLLILARIILSFVNIGNYEIRDLIYRLTEPFLAPVRNVLPPMGGLDFSPMIVLIFAAIIRRVLFNLLL